MGAAAHSPSRCVMMRVCGAGGSKELLETQAAHACMPPRGLAIDMCFAGMTMQPQPPPRMPVQLCMEASVLPPNARKCLHVASLGRWYRPTSAPQMSPPFATRAGDSVYPPRLGAHMGHVPMSMPPRRPCPMAALSGSARFRATQPMHACTAGAGSRLCEKAGGRGA